MADGAYMMNYPQLYGRWIGHDPADHGPDLGSSRPDFYEGLWREDEPVVWRFIEENYLFVYEDFVRVEFEWSAEGSWGIPFPGSVGFGEYLSPTRFGMPEPLAARIHAWQANPDTRAPFADPDDDEGTGQAVFGDDHHVEFRRFREISVQNGGPAELEVPRFITDLAR